MILQVQDTVKLAFLTAKFAISQLLVTHAQLDTFYQTYSTNALKTAIRITIPIK